MFGTDTAIIATGRFQSIHLGGLGYLMAAKYLAVETRSRFYILTGPLDEELLVHGSRAAGSVHRRFLTFDERKLLLAALLGIQPESVRNHRGSPHHGEPGLSSWVSGFFQPLLEDGSLASKALGDPHNKSVVLFTANKSDDVKHYRAGQASEHYSELLKAAYPAISAIDYFAISRPGSGLDKLSTSRLSPDDGKDAREEQENALPPAMLLAEMLLRRPGVPSLLPYAGAIHLISTKLGIWPTNEATLRAEVPSIF